MQAELFQSGAAAHTFFVQGKLEDYALVERAINDYAVDTVFHLGAQTLVEPARAAPLATFEANIRGTYHILEACRRFSSRIEAIVVASSDKAYGTRSTLPYTEDMAVAGRYPYDVSKSCADLLATSYFHTYDLPIIIVRSGNIYGGGDLNWSRLIPGTIKSYLHSVAPLIRSDGTPTRDYLFVEDVIAAYLLLAAHSMCPTVRGQAFNLGTNCPLSVVEVVETLQTLMGAFSLPPTLLSKAKGEIQDQWLTSEKIKSAVGWSPRFSLIEGLKKTLPWYEAYFKKAATLQEVSL